MKKFQLFIFLVIGGLTIFLEFRSIKESSFLGLDMFESVPLIILSILTVVYFVKNKRLFDQTKQLKAFVPSAIGLFILLLTFGHMALRSYIDNSKTLFSAVNFDLSNDGIFTLEFKENNYLTGRRIERLGSTYYWGSYTKRQDTLLLNINLDFKLGRKAVLKDSILRFTDDTTHLTISFPGTKQISYLTRHDLILHF